MSVISRKKMNRRGVSLLEILICVGILSIGLLGVAALIPAGHFAVVETTKADRSVACAKAAKANLQINGDLKAENWCVWSGSNFSPFDDGTSSSFRVNYINTRGATVVLDPLAIATCRIDPAMTYDVAMAFPYKTSMGNSGSLPLWRLTTERSAYSPAGASLTNDVAFSLSERRYRWTDDIKIKIDDTNPDQRPRQEFTFSSGDYGPYPDPAAGTPIVSEFYGDYSWFFTITPLGDYCTWNGTVNIPKPLEDFESYEVSTVICYKRNLVFDTAATIPQERPVDIANGFSGISGAGASDIPLVVPGTYSGSVNHLEYLDVKPGQWIMLVGRTKDSKLNYYTSSEQQGYRTVAKWYRILSVDDEMSGSDNKTRWITVTGPEWRTPAVLGSPQPGEMENTQAVIVDSVIGVFTETMTVER